MRPNGRMKDALSSLIYASCFPKIDFDFRADAVGRHKRSSSQPPAVRADWSIVSGRSSDLASSARCRLPDCSVAYGNRHPPHSVGHVAVLHRIPDSPAKGRHLTTLRMGNCRSEGKRATSIQPENIAHRRTRHHPVTSWASSSFPARQRDRRAFRRCHHPSPSVAREHRDHAGGRRRRRHRK